MHSSQPFSAMDQDQVEAGKRNGNYFALPRFIEKLRGGSAIRGEGNWLEACLTGAAIYLISYFFAANLIAARLAFWPAILALFGLIFVMWIFWLIVLYANSLIVKTCWVCGLCTDLPRTRIQSVLIGILTTAFAAQLMATGTWLRWIGVIWIMAVGLNLTAALLLALLYDERS